MLGLGLGFTSPAVLDVGTAAGGAALALSPTSLPNGVVGAAYSQAITASNGTAPYSFAVTSGTLPGGLTLSAAGLLSGTPTTAASFSFTITATDVASGSGSWPYTLLVTGVLDFSATANSGLIALFEDI